MLLTGLHCAVLGKDGLPAINCAAAQLGTLAANSFTGSFLSPAEIAKRLEEIDQLGRLQKGGFFSSYPLEGFAVLVRNELGLD